MMLAIPKSPADDYEVTEGDAEIKIVTPHLEAAIRKQGYEAWCHQRGYVCMIQELGGRPVPADGLFSAAFIVGYFDSIEEMHAVYDRYRGATALAATPDGWRLEPAGSD
jgi:hypothetical protein